MDQLGYSRRRKAKGVGFHRKKTDRLSQRSLELIVVVIAVNSGYIIVVKSAQWWLMVIDGG